MAPWTNYPRRSAIEWKPGHRKLVIWAFVLVVILAELPFAYLAWKDWKAYQVREAQKSEQMHNVRDPLRITP